MSHMPATVDLACGCASRDNGRARHAARLRRKATNDKMRRARERLKAFVAVYGTGGCSHKIGITTQQTMGVSVVPAVGGADVWRPVW